MKSKEEILGEYTSYMPKALFTEGLVEAMDEYAKSVAIEFAKWMDSEGYTIVTGAGVTDRWESLSDFKGKSSNELFNQFLIELQYAKQ